MIFRTSTCWAPNAEDAREFANFLNETLFPRLRTLAGHRGGYLLQRNTEKGEEVVIMTIWDSLDAVRAFAGEDIEATVFAPEAERLLPEREERVKHYEVILTPE